MSKVLEFYKYLHTIPESSMQEYKTSAFVAQELIAAGITVETNLAGSTGLVGIIDSGVPGPVFGLRADMDALNHNIDGKVEQRHTCGHDGHTSMLLAAALEIKEQGLVKKGKLKVIFQPGEETDDGAGTPAADGGGADGDPEGGRDDFGGDAPEGRELLRRDPAGRQEGAFGRRAHGAFAAFGNIHA